MRLGLFLSTIKRDYNKIPASYWIRVFQLFEHYQAMGIDVHLNNPTRTYDISIFYRRCNNWGLKIIKYLKRISQYVLWDTAVNYFETSQHVTEKQMRWAKNICTKVDGIITPSRYISIRAKTFHDTVYTFPDSIGDWYINNQKSNVNLIKPMFIWSGVSVKSDALNYYAKHLDNSCIILSDKKPRLLFNYQFLKWDFNTFPQHLIQGDIAFLPRSLRSPYNLGHSSFKALIFAIQSMPIIASKIPSYDDMSTFYNGIVFLEDHNFNIQSCINELRHRSLDNALVCKEYANSTLSRRFVDWLSTTYD